MGTHGNAAQSRICLGYEQSKQVRGKEDKKLVSDMRFFLDLTGPLSGMVELIYLIPCKLAREWLVAHGCRCNMEYGRYRMSICVSMCEVLYAMLSFMYTMCVYTCGMDVHLEIACHYLCRVSPIPDHGDFWKPTKERAVIRRIGFQSFCVKRRETWLLLVLKQRGRNSVGTV